MKRFRDYKVAFALVLVFFLLGVSLVVPIFNKRSVFEIIIGVKDSALDPLGGSTFGDDTEYGTALVVTDYHKGLVATMGATDGTANYIKAYMMSIPAGTTAVARGCIWETDGDLVAVSSEVALTEGITMTWYQFDLNGESLSADTEYIIGVWGDNPGLKAPYILYQSSGGSTTMQTIDTYHATNDPTNPETFGLIDSSSEMSIYCDYTEVVSNTAPTQSAQKVLDSNANHSLNATDVVVPPTAFWINISDVDGDKMNITIMENSSGWNVVNQTSGSGLTNGTYGFSNVSWVDHSNTTYYVTFNVTDGTNWCNESYHFTTAQFIVYDETPVNSSTGVDVSPVTYVTVSGGIGDTVTICWYNSTNGSTWSFQQKETGVAINNPNTRSWVYDEAYLVDTLYYWKVSVDNGEVNNSYIYHFTTDDFVYTEVRGGGIKIGDWTDTGNICDNNLSTYAETKGDGQVIYYTDIGESIPFYEFPDKEIKNVKVNFSAFYSTHSEYVKITLKYNGGDDVGDTNTFLVDSASNEYFEYDITRDTNAPSCWTWWDIENLYYHIESDINDGGTLRLSEFFIKVCHEPETTPWITDVSPFDGERNVPTDTAEVSMVINSTRGKFNYTIQGSCIVNTGDNDVEDGIYGANLEKLNADTTYTWYVNVSDSDDPTNYSQNYVIHFDTIDATEYDMLVITYSENYSIAKNFTDWKEANTDFTCKIVNVSDIISDSIYYINGSWGDNNSANTYYARQVLENQDYNTSAHQVRNFIRDQYKNYDISYVLMFGALVPYKYFSIWESESGYYADRPTDTLFYAMLNGTQNRYDWETVDANTYGWREVDETSAPDGLNQYSMDLIVARFPAYTSQELWYMVNKSKNYYAIDSDDIYCNSFMLYSENISDPGKYEDNDGAWTDTSWGLNNSYMVDMESDLTFVNGTGIAPGQTGQFDNCITQEQVNNSIYGIFNCTNISHPHSVIMYHYSTHSIDGYPEDGVEGNVSTDIWNNTYPYIQPPFGCNQGDWLRYDTGYLSTEIMRQRGGSVMVMGSSSYQISGTGYVGFFNLTLTNGTDGSHTMAEVWVDYYNEYATSYDNMRFNQFLGDPTLYYKGFYKDMIYDEHPVNGSVDLDSNPSCNITVYGVEPLTVTFASNYTDSWVNYQTNNSVSRDSVVFWDAVGATSGIYYWRVYRNDSNGNNVSETFHFTTMTWYENRSFSFIGGNSSSWYLNNTFSFSGNNLTSWVNDNAFSFSGDNLTSWYENNTFSFSGDNISNWFNDNSFSFQGNNITSWVNDKGFSFSGGNLTQWVNTESFSFSGDNISQSFLNSSFSFSGDNVTSWYENNTFSFSGDNLTAWVNDNSFSFSGGNTMCWSLDDAFSFSGDNLTSWYENRTFSFSGDNISNWFNDNSFSFQGGNSTAWVNDDAFSFSGDNLTDWIWTLTDGFSFSGDNITSWVNDNSFSFSGGNTLGWIKDKSFSFSGNNISYWSQDNSFSFMGNNVTTWINDNSFSFQGGNSTAWANDDAFSFSGNNLTDWVWTLTDGFSFMGGNATNWVNDNSFSFQGGNVSGILTWHNDISFSFMGGNATVEISITDEFPGNESFIQSLQPTVYFTLSNPSGRLMNYTIYIGNSSINTTTVLDTNTNVINGTYHYNNYFTASNYTSYWWKVSANDSVQTVNESFVFTTGRSGGGVISSGSGSIGIAAGAIMIGVIALVFAFSKRRRKNQ